MTRIAGNRGRQPVKAPADRFAIKYIDEYMGGTLPGPTYPVDVSGGITEFGMLGNGPDPTCTTHPQGVGDCYFAARQHYRMCKAADEGAPMPTETSNQLVAEYLAYDNGQDVGVNVADVLLAEYRAGIILGFAPVDHTDRIKCDGAMQQFHGLILGGDLTADADQRFNDGLPWTVAEGQQPDPEDGHCFLRVKSSGPGPLDMSTDVTWGAEQESTAGWDAACLVEAWVAITSEDQIDPQALAALQADIDALDGTGGKASPSPAPTPIHNHGNMLIELAGDVEAVLNKARGYLERHGLSL